MNLGYEEHSAAERGKVKNKEKDRIRYKEKRWEVAGALQWRQVVGKMKRDKEVYMNILTANNKTNIQNKNPIIILISIKRNVLTRCSDWSLFQVGVLLPSVSRNKMNSPVANKKKSTIHLSSIVLIPSSRVLIIPSSSVEFFTHKVWVISELLNVLPLY